MMTALEFASDGADDTRVVAATACGCRDAEGVGGRSASHLIRISKRLLVSAARESPQAHTC